MLLDKFHIPFEQRSVAFDEEQIGVRNPLSFVFQASKGKSLAAAKAFGLSVPLLCADTVIVGANHRLIRKPKHKEDAREILLAQSDSQISIVSSVFLQTEQFSFSSLDATHYHFAPFDRDDLEHYLESGEWEGKAGGCMVEGFCKTYIEQVVGYESTAMGLQVEVLLPWLRRV
jgi:septum formation protein